jgi:hypothetical protein
MFVKASFKAKASPKMTIPPLFFLKMEFEICGVF